MAPPNLKYINQSAPFWDWIASFEQSATEHPFFGGAHNGPNQQTSGSDDDERGHSPPGGRRGGGPAPWAGPWSGAWGGAPWSRGFNWHGAMPHHPPPHGHGPPPHGPPPHYHEGPNPPEMTADEKVKEGDAEKGAVPDPPEEAPGCSDREGRRRMRKEWKQAKKDARAFGGPRGGHHHHHHPYSRGGRGGWGGMPGRGGFRMLSDLFGPGAQNDDANAADWKPEADAFDTEGAFVVHVSLPGAHKEDIGVTWDAEKSELTIAGVVHRPGDEAFLKTLALDERKSGAFERKVRLGTRANPAHVDVEGITAKLENGILIVDVPKLNGEFVEVKKVDIE